MVCILRVARQLKNARDRVHNGLIKLLETNELVDKMKKELVVNGGGTRRRSLCDGNTVEKL